jgi:hypothetical protein
VLFDGAPGGGDPAQLAVVRAAGDPFLGDGVTGDDRSPGLDVEICEGAEERLCVSANRVAPSDAGLTRLRFGPGT